MKRAAGEQLISSIASAPLTYSWLAILFVTTRVQRRAGPRGARRLQRDNSTNLDRLQSNPLRVLVTSLFWLDGRQWWPYVPAFVGLVAPAERRLRWWRWLFIGVTAHVVGTYLGQTHLGRRIRKGVAPKRLVRTRDVGVSYFVLGVAGALTGHAGNPWRSRCQLAGVGVLAVNAAVRPTHTEVGHLTAFVVGLAAAALGRSAPSV
jgi:hypothetical protein